MRAIYRCERYRDGAAVPCADYLFARHEPCPPCKELLRKDLVRGNSERKAIP